MEFRGLGVSEGTVSREALVFRHEPVFSEETASAQEDSFEAAMKKFYRGRGCIHEELLSMAKEAEKKYGADKAGIYEGYAEILMDDEIEDLVKTYIQGGSSAGAAAQKALEEQARQFEALEGGVMKERGSDLMDIGRRLGAAVSGVKYSLPVLTEPCILVTDELSPFEAVQLDHGKILGLAMDRGGYSGHMAILARSLGIPCVTALGNVSAITQSGTLCALDGGAGRFIIEPDRETINDFREKEDARQECIAGLAKASEPVCTKDGVSIPVCANIGYPVEAERAAALGADGVGVFRTELMYMDMARLPSEEEQFQAYRQCLNPLGGRPLCIRTLDIGGDKDHPGLGLKKEDNPFLGYRAIRLSLDQSRIFKPQLRAILRTAAFSRVELMLPLISTLDEIRQARSVVEECRRELASEGLEAGNPPLGIMVETPAAALMAREFAPESDFFSIGTNDLAQYTLAADRGNSRVSKLYDPLDPAVLRLMALTCEAAEEAGIEAGICGELAADPKALPLLIGLGIKKLSVSIPRIPGVKAEIRNLDSKKCRELAREALGLSTVQAVHALLSAFRS